VALLLLVLLWTRFDGLEAGEGGVTSEREHRWQQDCVLQRGSPASAGVERERQHLTTSATLDPLAVDVRRNPIWRGGRLTAKPPDSG
jgi:hypothetical protein